MQLSLKQWLDQAKKDAGSHLALDLFVGFFLLVGGPHRTKAAVFDPAFILHTSFYALRAWGALLFVIGLLMLASFVLGNQTLYAAVRSLLAMYFGFWAGLFLVSFLNGDSSPFGVAFGIGWFARTIRLPVDNPWRKVRLSE